MTEQEIIELQTSGSKSFLMQVGMFIHAYEGGDATEDESLVAEPKPAKAPKPEVEKTLLDEVLGYNLAASTPMAAMLFLSDLQQRYGKK